MKNFGYITPKTLEEASGLLKNPRTAAMGGGTDLLKLDNALAGVDDFIAERLG